MMNMSYFQMPGQIPTQNPFYTSPMSYTGAQPAALFGPGAAVPNSGMQIPGQMNPQMMGMMGGIGQNLMSLGQRSPQPQSIGAALGQSALPMLMARNPQMMQGLMGLLHPSFGG